MNINQLRYFLLIHQLGSINKAAQKSNISPQSISIAIKKLEEELGCALFIRDGRKKLSLSESGQLFLQTADEVVQKIDQAQTQLTTLEACSPTNRHKESLNILVSPAFGLSDLPGIAKALSLIHISAGQHDIGHQFRDGAAAGGNGRNHADMAHDVLIKALGMKQVVLGRVKGVAQIEAHLGTVWR